MFNASKSDTPAHCIYESLKDLGEMNCLLPADVFADKDKYDEILYKLFMLIIDAGSTCYSIATRYEDGINATNYLKKDKNYYGILRDQWSQLSAGIKQILGSL